MATLPEPIAPEVDPLAWLVGYRWAGDRHVDMQVQECDRAAWLAGRWASSSRATMQALSPFRPVAAIVSAKTPPPIEEGIAAELLCGTCAQFAVCRGAERLARSCRTCTHVIVDGGWYCGLNGAELSVPEQRRACISWLAVR